MKTIDTATQAELDKQNYYIASLVSFYGIGGTDTFLTDAPQDISYSGNTYLCARGLLGISAIQEDEDLKIEQVEIVLTGIDSENVKLFLDYDYIDRRVTIHRAVITDAATIVGSPVLIFDGRLDQPRVTEDWSSRKADVGVSAASHWSNFEESSGRHTNDTEQQVLFTGDVFFDKAADTQKDIKWGKA